MNILIMGRPGAGKGTQAHNINSHYHIPHISTGDMFRGATQKGTSLGKLAKSYMEKGLLVPDDITIGIVKERLSESDCKNGFLLDGFPRTIKQAEALDQILNELNIKLDVVLDINVDIDVLLKRIVGRRVCKTCQKTYHHEFNPPKVLGLCDNCGKPLVQRNDDLLETAKSRLQVYDNQTAPLIDYYKSLVREVNGDQDVLNVFSDIKDILGESNG